MAKARDKNVEPLTNYKQLAGEMNYEDFEYKDKFGLICTLKPNKKLENLECELSIKKNAKGVVSFIYSWLRAKFLK